MTEKKKRKLDPKIIRPGDKVRIVIPRMVVRVGYPKTVSDYYDEAEKALGEELDKFLGLRGMVNPDPRTKPQYRNRALHEIAYARAKQDGFGGRERTLHLKDVPEYQGKILYVAHLRTVWTGRYYPPSGFDEDYEPGGLSNAKSHRLVEVFSEIIPCGMRDAEFPLSHVEKVL